MNLRTFLTVSAIVALLYALGLILMPATLGPMYGFAASAGEKLISQFFGVELLALGIIQWLSKDLPNASVRPIIIGSLVANVVGVIVSVMGTLGGVMNSVGWSSVAIYLLLALGFAYFQFMAPAR